MHCKKKAFIYALGNSTIVGWTNGDIWGVGENDSNAGPWFMMGQTTPVKASTPFLLSNYTGATKFFGFEVHSCATMADGSVKCGGNNGGSVFAPGMGANIDNATVIPEWANAKQFISSDGVTCIIAQDDSVQCTTLNGVYIGNGSSAAVTAATVQPWIHQGLRSSRGISWI